MEKYSKRKQLSLLYRCSFTRLGLNYYTFYETLFEQAFVPEKIMEISREFNRILGEFLEGKGELSQLDTLRNRIIGDMEIVTAYTDCFQIYEYVLNRVERRFVKGEPVRSSVETFVLSLMETLSQDRDAAILNSRIQEIMGQLPVRYTKQKFYSLLMERLTVYAGTGKKGFEDLLYLLKTSSMVSLPENMKTDEEELYAFLEKLRHMNYRHMNKEEYWECVDCIHNSSDRLRRDAGLYLLVSDLVNDLYVLFLSRQEALVDSQEEQVFENLAKEVLKQFEREDKAPLGKELFECLEKLEGIQEDTMERLTFEDGEQDDTLLKIQKLTSGSSFARLDETEDADEPADRAWIEEKGRELCKELDQAFSGMEKPVVMAMMAKMFSYLPVVFRSMQELETYIRDSLESCTDLAEQEACMEILTWEMMEEDALV